MLYLEVQIQVNASYVEILVAELSFLHFESFVENEEGVTAYILDKDFQAQPLEVLKEQYQDIFTFKYTTKIIQPQNWNAVWEASYQPIIIRNQCVVKSDFHQMDKQYPYEIIINPKMSFGTGHHETTKMMIEFQLDYEHHNMDVLDVGCGTGVLSIMAAKRGAKKIVAFDIDEWAVTNTQENIHVNACKQIQVSKNTIKNIILEDDFDIILANINRNVLLEEIPCYAKLLKKGALLVMSGFYEKDREPILQVAQKFSLSFDSQKNNNQWMALALRKIN